MMADPTLDELVSLKVGDTFTYRGRRWTVADYRGWWFGGDARGEFVRLPVWDADKPGPSRKVTIRDKKKEGR